MMYGDGEMQGVPTAEECRAQIDRLLRSEALRHSASLKKLLEYLADASLVGKAHELKEYTVGIEALSKPSEYDPRTDSSVRVLAGKLRQKLKIYYAEEGAQDRILVTFPKGRFELEFARRPAAPSKGVLATPSPGAERPFWKVAAPFVFAVLLVTALYALWFREQRSAATPAPAAYPSPEFEAFWKPLLESPEPLVIALGSPMFISLGPDYLRIPSINRWEDFEGKPKKRELEKRFGIERSFPRYDYTGIGEALGAFLLAKRLTPMNADLLLVRSILLSWDQIRSQNVVFLGSAKFNPQIKDVPVQLDFLDEGGITNLRPQPGERRIYVKEAVPGSERLLMEYALITRIRGVPGWREILVLGSSSSPATRAAVEYVLDPTHLKQLHQRLRQPDGTFPACYQVVIRGKFRGDVPITLQYVTHHVLRGPSSKTYKSP